MVGQPDTYLAAAYQQDWLRRKSKKHMEFIFYAERSSEKKSISAALRQDFESAHQLPPGEDEDDWAWGYWRNELKKPGARIPVFYLESGGRIEHFGLAQLFRINYRHTLQQRLPDDHKSARPDMAELIFGPMGRSEKFWRGRVSGQPFVAVGNPQPAPLEVAVLGTPRPSFYPNYLEQPNPQQGYKTLEDNDAGLRGWKRFPVPSDGVRLAPNPPIADQGRHKMGASTYFRPLPPGTTFTGEISFHNLRPWELGALLWALGFGKTVTEQPDSNLRHSLGMAKPLGGGAVLLTVTGIEATNAHGAKEEGVEATALTAFGERMASSCAGGSWETSSRMNELLLMADQSKQPSNPQALSHPREVKYFADFKKNREALVPFSKLPGVQQ